MRSSRRLAGVIVAMLLLLGACGGDDDTSSSANGTGSDTEAPENGEASGEPIKIGVIVSQSGYASWLGEDAVQGMEILEEIVSSDGGIDGRPIELLIKDDQSDPEAAVRAARELLEEDIVMLLGASLTPTSLAIEPLAAQAEVPMIAMSGGYQPADSEASPWGWSVVAGVGPAIIKAFEWALDEGMSKVATITPTDPLGEQGDMAFTRLLEGEGPFAGRLERVGHAKFNLEDADVRPQLQELSAGNPDFIFAGVSGEAVVTIRKQMDELGLEDVPLVTYHSNTTWAVLQLLEGTKGSLVLPGTAVNVVEDLPDGELKQEIEKFKDHYGADEPPLSGEGFGYDALKVAVEAIRAAGPDRAAIRDWLDEGQTIIGINNVMTFSADKHVAATAEDLLIMEAVPGERFRLVGDLPDS